MSLENIRLEDFFPVIRQTIQDAFKTNSFLFSYPYENVDEVDMGFRKMVWSDHYNVKPSFFSEGSDEGPHLVVIESSLRFYNVVALLEQKEHPDFICFGPFCDKEITSSLISKIVKENHIAPKHLNFIKRFYMGLPVININDFIATVRHLLSVCIPEFSVCPLEHINYSTETHEYNTGDERFYRFNAAYAERFAEKLQECTDAIVSGNTAKSTEKMKALIDFLGAFMQDVSPQNKRYLSTLNSIIMARLLQTSIHSLYIFQQSEKFEYEILQTASAEQLQHIPFEMARKYSLLAKNYAYDDYSYLIHNIVNYIEQNLTGDLSLAAIAEEFEKNPSYLSNAFKKEVGETITAYVRKKRMQTAIRYFNTTQMSVAEVAQAVGIPDFSYFSKDFKRQIGVSPREYKKMLDK